METTEKFYGLESQIDSNRIRWVAALRPKLHKSLRKFCGVQHSRHPEGPVRAEVLVFTEREKSDMQKFLLADSKWGALKVSEYTYQDNIQDLCDYMQDFPKYVLTDARYKLEYPVVGLVISKDDVIVASITVCAPSDKIVARYQPTFRLTAKSSLF